MGYNLNFIPTPEKINKKELLDDINNFNRRIKLKSHFGEAAPKEGLYFKSNTSWEPPNPHYTVKTFTESFKNKIVNCLNKNKSNQNENNLNRKNWNKKEIKALNDLKEREDIVITNADKGAQSS